MDIVKLYEEELKIEQYVEEKKVYEFLKGIMKDLVIHRPADPVEYLIGKLEKPKVRRIFILGPPSSGKKEIGLSLEDVF